MEEIVHKSEGFCDAIKISKAELQESETQKELEKFQKKRLE
jgi:hypothetical protein